MKNICVVIISLLFIFGENKLAFAQDRPLFERKVNADLTPQQERVLAHYRAQATTQSIEIISVNKDVLKADSQFSVNINNETALKFQTITKDIRSDQLSVSAKPTTEGAGLTTFDVKDGQVTGAIFTPTGVFRVQPLGGDLQALIKVDQSKFPKDHPPAALDKLNKNNDMPVEKDKIRVVASEERGGEYSLKVLVAYTSDVADLDQFKIINVDQLARQAIALSNSSYLASGIRIKMLSASAKALKLDYRESGSYQTDLDALRSKTDGKMDEIHKERELTGANVVVLLVTNSSYCGLAADIPGSDSKAFAAVNYDCAVANLSFPHEIGHLQGARHDLVNDPTPGYNHGFVNVLRRQRTIMAYPCAGDPCTRMPEWSRPLEWGSDNNENNARVLNETAREIEKWGRQGALAARQ